MKLAKLDTYDYDINMTATFDEVIIRFAMDGFNDPDIVDILSEIQNSDGNIYIDGHYYKYSDEYKIFEQLGNQYMDLKARQIS